MKKRTIKIRLIILIFCIVIASGIIKFYGDNEEKTLKVKRNKAEIKEVQIEKKSVKVKFPSLEETIKKKEGKSLIVKNPDSYLVFINKEIKLPDFYEPSDLVTPNVPFVTYDNSEKTKLRSVAASALEKLFNDAKQQGLKLYALSGYRSFQRQGEIYESNVNQKGKEFANLYSAAPGHSEHQTGLAMDLTTSDVNFELIESFADTKEGKWLVKNASKYGFIIRYPKEKIDITGYAFEPWHIRYIGKNYSNYLSQHNLTLDEVIK